MAWDVGEKILDRWEVRGVLSGGMGRIYVSFDHAAQEAVAMKTLRDDVLERQPQATDLFVQEALLWTQLDMHPNVTEAKRVENVHGMPHLILELVGGGDLGGWIGTPRLTKRLRHILGFAVDNFASTCWPPPKGTSVQHSRRTSKSDCDPHVNSSKYGEKARSTAKNSSCGSARIPRVLADLEFVASPMKELVSDPEVKDPLLDETGMVVAAHFLIQAEHLHLTRPFRQYSDSARGPIQDDLGILSEVVRKERTCGS